SCWGWCGLPNHRLGPVAGAVGRISPHYRTPYPAYDRRPGKRSATGQLLRLSKTRQRLSVPIKQRA
ncbi:MAG: hypothetical protein E6Y37_06445, partial [Enterobacter hormaechei]|nr:hypothetical protein [Enterobacter hormaechei]